MRPSGTADEDSASRLTPTATRRRWAPTGRRSPCCPAPGGTAYSAMGFPRPCQTPSFPQSHLTVRRWKDKPNGDRFHNRYILRDMGGVMFGAGLDEGSPWDQLTILRHCTSASIASERRPLERIVAYSTWRENLEAAVMISKCDNFLPAPFRTWQTSVVRTGFVLDASDRYGLRKNYANGTSTATNWARANDCFDSGVRKRCRIVFVSIRRPATAVRGVSRPSAENVRRIPLHLFESDHSAEIRRVGCD